MSTNTIATGTPAVPPLQPIGDTCRESKISGELNAEYQRLDQLITIKAARYATRSVRARNDFDELMPLLDKMQALLSKRGNERQLMDCLGLPTWTEWFKEFRPRLKEDVTIRTIQRRLQEYRGKKPTKKTRQRYDAADIAHLELVFKAAQQLAEADVDNLAYNPIREAILHKPESGSIPGVVITAPGIPTPVHTKIAQLALRLAQATLSYEGVDTRLRMMAQEIVDLMSPAPKVINSTESGDALLKLGNPAALTALGFGDPR